MPGKSGMNGAGDMEPGIHLWREGRTGLAEPLTPDGLATLHPAWAEAVAGHGPWREEGAWLVAATPVDTPVLIAGPCTSTQDVLAALAGELDLPAWTSLLSPVQRAGRGQLRRDWFSPPGNLYVSTLWPDLGRPWQTLLPLLAGVAAATALRGLGVEAWVKWPNDVLVNGRKVVGILVEDRGGRIIVGTGFNCHWAPPAADMRPGHIAPAGSLAEAGLALGPLALWLAVFPRMRAVVAGSLAGGPQSFVREAEELLALLGRTVSVADGESRVTGRIAGLAPDGGLRLLQDDGEQVLYSGSVLDLY